MGEFFDSTIGKILRRPMPIKFSPGLIQMLATAWNKTEEQVRTDLAEGLRDRVNRDLDKVAEMSRKKNQAILQEKIHERRSGQGGQVPADGPGEVRGGLGTDLRKQGDDA